MDATPDPQHDDRSQPAEAAPREATREELRVTVRRSPKYGVFMAIAALVGTVVAWIVSSNVGPSVDTTGRQVDTTPVIGLMLVVGFFAGGALGAVIAIVVDRSLSRGVRTLVAERVETREPDAADESTTDAGEGAFERLEPAPDDPATGGAAARRDDRPREA